MDTTPPAPPESTRPDAPPPQARESAFFDSLRRTGLTRTDDRWVGGVASGIAHRLDIDPLIVRGAFVVLTLFGGLSALLYGLGWALLPEHSDGRIHLQEAFRGRFDAALAGAAALVVAGLARPVQWFQPSGWVVGLFWTGLVIAMIVIGVQAADRRRTERLHRTPPPQPTPGAAMPSSAAPPPTTPPYPAQSGAGEPSTAPYPASAGAGEPPTVNYPAPPGGGQPPTGGYPPAQPPARAPRTRGPGSVVVAITFAASFFAAAGILIAHRLELLTGSAALTVTGVSIAILGIGALVSGLRGRRAGALAGVAVLLAVFAVPAAVVGSALPNWRERIEDGTFIAADTTWAPQTADQAADGFSYGVGEALVDLTGPDWTLEAGERPTTVLIEAGAGSTQVIVPSGVPLEIRASLGAGEIISSVAGAWTQTTSTGVGTTGLGRTTVAQGANLDVELRSPAEGDLALIVAVEAGFGEIIITEENR